MTELDPREDFSNKCPRPDGHLKEVALSDSPDHWVKIGANLPLNVQNNLISLLNENADLFAYSPSDMLGIDPSFISYKLSLDPRAKPMAQKRRKLGTEKQKAINEEVKRLLDVGFIREIQYTTWLANVVMVKKSNGKCRMCVDFTDLNKACPKDSYPLLCINKLVDGASGYQYLSFMDTY